MAVYLSAAPLAPYETNRLAAASPALRGCFGQNSNFSALKSGGSLHKGSCLCGEVTFEVSCELPPANACHCVQCRKHSGHFEASTDVPRSAVTVYGVGKVSWYKSSEKVRRGFCSICGSSLFWDPLDTQKNNWTAIALGAFDTPTNTKLKQHIFVAEKGDYYEIGDGLPQNRH